MTASVDGETVIFVGLGRVGAPIARRLIASGLPIKAYDKDPGKLEAFELRHRLDPQKSPFELQARTVIICLPDPASAADSVQAWLRGRPPSGSVLIDLGTMQPALAQALAAEASQAGVHYLDAPLSGGERGAETGDMVVMVSGDADAARGVWPVLETIGRTVRFLGESGRASILKSINQMMYISYNLAFADGLRLADQFQFRTADALDCLANGAPRHPLIDDRLKARGEKVFEIARCVKDMECFSPAGDVEGEATALFNVVLQRLRAAVAAGRGKDDILSLSEVWP